MTTDFRDIGSTVDSSRLHGDPSGAQRAGRRPQTLLDETDGAPSEPPFALPSVRAETGALLERQMLISAGLETRRLPPTFIDRGSRRIALISVLFALAVVGAGAALHVHYQNVQEELRGELGARSEEIALVRANNELLLREHREAELRLEKTAGELAREATEKERLRLDAESKGNELNLARRELLSLRGEIDGLKERHRRLEVERLSELGEFLEESFLLPLELFRSLSEGGNSDAGPVPRDLEIERAAPLVEPAQESTPRPPPPARAPATKHSAAKDE